MQIVNSDHSPIVLKLKPRLTSGVNFKYEAYWEEHEECRDMVNASWESVSKDTP